MKIISEITVRVKQGGFSSLIEDLQNHECTIQKLNLLEKTDERQVYVIELVSSNKELFNNFVQLGNRKYKIEKISNTLEEKIRGGLLNTGSKLEFNNFYEYQVNLLGASELLAEKIREGRGPEFSGISRNIGIVSGLKSENENVNEMRFLMHLKSELDGAVINAFAGYNSAPLIIEYTQPEDFIKSIQRLASSFALMRINHIDGADISLYNQITSDLSIPFVSSEIDDMPLLLLTMILKIFKKNKINPGDATIGLIGVDISSIRLTRLLVRLGCMRVLGYDYSEKLLLSFENMEGLATTTDNIFSNADIVILLKGDFDNEAYQKIRPGQFVISLLDESMHDREMILSRGVREFVSINKMDILTLVPGMIRGVVDSGLKRFDDTLMVDFCRKLVNVLHDDYTFPDIYSDIHSTIVDIINIEGIR